MIHPNAEVLVSDEFFTDIVHTSALHKGHHWVSNCIFARPCTIPDVLPVVRIQICSVAVLGRYQGVEEVTLCCYCAAVDRLG